MSEYGQVVAHGGNGGASGGGSSTDIGSAISASFGGALNQASATLGIPPTVLLVLIAAVVLFALWFVFAR